MSAFDAPPIVSPSLPPDEPSVPGMPVENIRMLRHQALGGVELLVVQNSLRQWKVFNTVHSISISNGWIGSVHYRGVVSEIAPGSVFCTEPGEPHTTSRPAAAAGLQVLMIDEAVLREQLVELDFRGRDVHFSEAVTRKAAPQLRSLNMVMSAGGTQLELQSAFVELVATVAQELLADRPPCPVTKDDLGGLADDMRDLVHARVDEGTTLSLDELATAANLSRFRALRAFKRRHGVPPHTYELCLRLSRARELIKAGTSVVTAAMESGFADQSHLTRHFRNFYGYTPAQHGRGGAAKANRVF
jgi:AraC-like DNA-binding protein